MPKKKMEFREITVKDLTLPADILGGALLIPGMPVTDKSGREKRRLTPFGLTQPTNIEPDGYTPPDSPQDLLLRYSRGERYFERAQLKDAKLGGISLADANFTDANLENVDFTLSYLFEVDFTGANLKGAGLMTASMPRACFDRADLTGAWILRSDMAEVSLNGTILGGNQILGTRFTRTDLSQIELRGEITGAACTADHWTLTKTGEQLEAVPASLTRVESFLRSIGVPEEEWPWRRMEGLTLYLQSDTDLLDRLLVEGLIYAVLGPDTDCRVVEYREVSAGKILRLKAGDARDLESVAEAISQRVWREAAERESAAMVRLRSALNVSAVETRLEQLADGIEKMILSMPNSDALEMLADEGAAHIKDKDLRLIRTWPQKLGRATAKRLLQELAGELEGVIRDSTAAE